MSLSKFELVKYFKKIWVECTKRGDMPPTVVVERKGVPLLIVTAPEVDKVLGLKCAEICRVCMDADAITLICDAHMTMVAKPEDLEKWKHRRMQDACDEEGACATGEITDCIQATRVDSNLKMECHCIPYDYHGKDGGIEFKWKLDGQLIMDEATEGVRIEGYISDVLREIMKLKPLIEDESFNKGSDKFFQEEISEEKKLYHTGRVCRRLLAEKGYLIMEMVEVKPGASPEDMMAEVEAKLKEVGDIYEQASRHSA
jgi:hypothetical protein